jgi:diguanylate cyclase (GGDEF)-like protein
MSTQHTRPRAGAARGAAGRTTRKAAKERELADLRRLGRALHEDREQVVARIAQASEDSGLRLEGAVEQRFRQIGSLSTVAVAGWMSGDDLEKAREVGLEVWQIIGQLAAQRAATLTEVTKLCLRWRDAASEIVREHAAEERLRPKALAAALLVLQQTLDLTLVHVCDSFEAERRRTDEELAFLATHDALTGLPNRTLISDRIEQMLARSRRQRTPIAAVFIDLDNFKMVNDTFGHAVGDELLQSVAMRLQAVLRETDALGRLGGDEFVVVAEEVPMEAGAGLIAERLAGALKKPFMLAEGAHRVQVCASIGVACGTGKTSAEDLLRNADIAMYRAKWEGKNRCVVFESEMHGEVQSRMELELDLREALAARQFYLAYQPIFDLDRLTPVGVEALIRWRHPSRGLVQPEDFVPLLEETGLITEIGRWVLDEACRQGAIWRAGGHEIGIAVNVSARQLDTEDFVAHVKDALVASGLDPHALTLEITETTIMRDAGRTAQRLELVKQLGVRVAIDDFGTGYSSLGHLQRFPVDALKIDRSFISGLRRSQEGEAIIHTLVQLGKALSIETVAEGIEAHLELDHLRSEQCDGGQGFLFARPLDVEGIELFLRDWAQDASVAAAAFNAAAPAASSPDVARASEAA